MEGKGAICWSGKLIDLLSPLSLSCDKQGCKSFMECILFMMNPFCG